MDSVLRDGLPEEMQQDTKKGGSHLRSRQKKHVQRSWGRNSPHVLEEGVGGGGCGQRRVNRPGYRVESQGHGRRW